MEQAILYMPDNIEPDSPELDRRGLMKFGSTHIRSIAV